MASAASQVAPPASPTLSASQLATLAEVGEERTADVGEVLYRIGDASYPFIAILEGEVAIVDAAGNEIVRHGASSFLGELNLLSGQTVFVTAVVTQPLRFIAVERERCARSSSRTGRSATSCSAPSSPGARGFSECRAWGSRSSVRIHRKRQCGCSTSPGAIGSHSPGAIPSAGTIRRRPTLAGRPRPGQHPACATAWRNGAARPVDWAGLTGPRHRPRARPRRGS